MSHNKQFLFTLAAILVFFYTSVNELKGFERSEKFFGLLGTSYHRDHNSHEIKSFNVARDVFSYTANAGLLINKITEAQSGIFFLSDPGIKMYPGLISLAVSEVQSLVDDTDPNDSPNKPVLKRFWERFISASLKVKILVVILMYLLISIVLLFLGILIVRQVKSARRKHYTDMKNLYQEQLAGFLFDEEVERIEFKGIGKRVNRQILIDEIMDLHHNLYGEAAGKLKDLYFNLGLHRDSISKVYKGRWDERSKGFRELAQMDVKDANDKINKFINSKNPILRMEAQVAMVKLSEEDPLAFMDELKHELSYWEQINIHDTIVYHQIAIDSFERWCDADNPSVVVFALRMIGLFKHVNSAARVREKLFDENPDISLAAVQAMRELEITEYSDDLKTLYKSETLKLINILETQRKNKEQKDIKSLDDITPRKIRFEIIKSFQPIASPADIPFLEKEVLNSDNTVKLRMFALEILLSIIPEGEEKIEELGKAKDELVKKMIVNIKENQES